MRDREIDKFHVSEGVTYVSGLGFIAPNNTQKTVRNIHRLSQIICLCLLLFFFCQKMFFIPSTYIAYILGFDIKINHFTGLIVSSTASKFAIKFITTMLSLAICCCVLWVSSLRNLKIHSIFCYPKKIDFSVAFPIILATGLLGKGLGEFFSDEVGSLGIILSPISDYSIENKISFTIFKIVTAMLIVLLQEFLFRGAILFALDPYGEGFAIITSSILFALFQNGIIEIISSFFLGLVLSYFTVKSKNIYTAFIGRSTLILLFFAFDYINKVFETSLAQVIILLFYLIILTSAGFAFIFFVQKNKDAFTLNKSYGSISLRRRLAAFFSTISFILFLIVIINHVVETIQIIG